MLEKNTSRFLKTCELNTIARSDFDFMKKITDESEIYRYDLKKKHYRIDSGVDVPERDYIRQKNFSQRKYCY